MKVLSITLSYEAPKRRTDITISRSAPRTVQAVARTHGQSAHTIVELHMSGEMEADWKQVTWFLSSALGAPISKLFTNSESHDWVREFQRVAGV